MTTSKGDTLWAWQEYDGEDWGLITAQIDGTHLHLPIVGPTTIQLCARSEQVARVILQPLAEGHYRSSGHPVRLARFELAGSEPLLST